MEEDIKILKASLKAKLFFTDSYYKAIENILNELERLQKENELYKHRLEVANEFIESRIDNMIPEHYEDLKYIINECDMNSSW